ncbi:MAG: M20/M25/M40 family metallo-hydrolase [Robiginitomaculum sp.]|nr:M20/M25/M40 family metallo-hydrolase [Robiginitomaculum sp.]
MMKKYMGIFGLFFMICCGCTSTHAADDAAQKYQDKALEMIRVSVSMRTAKGFGNVPELATYIADEFKSAGFDQKDIHLLPMGDTAALVIRYRGDGSSGKKPILLSAHMDVVDALPKDWERDPFTLIEENGYYYGRGVNDNKFGIAVLAATMMRLKSEGFVPNRDIILALTGDEETRMITTRSLVTEYRHLIDAEFALIPDGGGGHLDENGKAVSFSVDSAEKTYATFEMTARNSGGHSSRPKRDNAIADLSAALNKVFRYEFPVRTNELTLSYFEQTAPLVGGTVGDAMKRFAENPQDKDAVSILRSIPVYVGSLGTTCVPTMLRAGHAENALPQSATATINCRVFPGLGVDETLARLKKIVANDAIEWKGLGSPLESDASPVRKDVFEAISRGVHASYPDLPIIPHMASGASDALHFRAVGIPSYTFSGIFIKDSDKFSHGLNERIPTDTLPVAMKMWRSILMELAS